MSLPVARGRPVEWSTAAHSYEGHFPLKEFDEALRGLRIEQVKEILTAQGLGEVADSVEERLNLIQRETLQYHQAIPLDEVYSLLLVAAIERMRLDLLPAIHPFSGVSAAMYQDRVAQKATRAFCEKLDEESFQMFLAVMKKYAPENATESLKIALHEAAVRGKQDMIDKLRRSFPHEMEPIINEMFQADRLMRFFLAS
jgi:hypothetical protein